MYEDPSGESQQLGEHEPVARAVVPNAVERPQRVPRQPRRLLNREQAIGGDRLFFASSHGRRRRDRRTRTPSVPQNGSASGTRPGRHELRQPGGRRSRFDGAMAIGVANSAATNSSRRPRTAASGTPAAVDAAACRRQTSRATRVAKCAPSRIRSSGSDMTRRSAASHRRRHGRASLLLEDPDRR